jgi:hypothetical protein
MMPLLFWVLTIYGATNIVTCSYLFKPLREAVNSRSKWLGKLTTCPMCLGFWVGLFSALLGFYPGPALFPVSWPWWAQAWALGAFASGCCWILHVALEKLMLGLDL